LAALFRGKFLAGLKLLLADAAKPLVLPESTWQDPDVLFSKLYAQPWHIHIQAPLGGPKQVLAYLANYTHRVALSNRRLVCLDAQRQTVTFTYRDYRDNSTVKLITLSAMEFIRRFSWHILPRGLVRIRHYGILGNNRRHRDIAKAKALLETPSAPPSTVPTTTVPTTSTPSAPSTAPPQCCPHCGSQNVHWIGFIDPRGRWHLALAAKLDSS
jgi:hypothetical protein